MGGLQRGYIWRQGPQTCARASKVLYGLVRDHLQLEPLSGHLFLFSNAQRNRLKLLFWDGSGLWVCAKRLEKGRFGWPAPVRGQAKVVLSHEELALLLGGIDLAGSKRRAWFRKIIDEEPKNTERAPKILLTV